MRILILALMIGGCGGKQFITPPRDGTIVTTVVWMTRQEVQAKCGRGTEACASVGRWQGEMNYIWAQRPDSFDDLNACRLGHELLHNLGATH